MSAHGQFRETLANQLLNHGLDDLLGRWLSGSDALPRFGGRRQLAAQRLHYTRVVRRIAMGRKAGAFGLGRVHHRKPIVDGATPESICWHPPLPDETGCVEVKGKDVEKHCHNCSARERFVRSQPSTFDLPQDVDGQVETRPPLLLKQGNPWPILCHRIPPMPECKRSGCYQSLLSSCQL